MKLLLIIITLTICIIWYLVHIKMIRILAGIPLFDLLNPPIPKRWPKLSVIIPACNEEETIESALSSLLNQDYPDIEVIVLNDRSTDKTGVILSAMEKRYPSLHVVHIDNLPEGWLGKVHALHVGTQKAEGEWILHTDADVCFSKGALKKGIALAVSNSLDHLSVAPGFKTTSYLFEVVVNAFGAAFLFFTDAGNVNNGKSKKAVGVGAFNLVRKSVLDRTEGFEWLKMEVADDVGLALMMKNAGAKGFFSIAKEEINISWYSGIKEMFHGLEKNIFGATCSYSYFKMVLMVTLTFAYTLGPFVAMGLGIYTFIPGLVAYLMLVCTAILRSRRFGSRFSPDLFTPLGQMMVSIMLIYAAFFCWKQGGIKWRGTLYSLDALREGQRVKL